MKIFFIISLILVTFIWNVCATDDDFHLLDANKNGIVDKEELTKAVTKKFFLYDKNKDGFIDHNELNPHGDPDIAREFDLMDINKDKKVGLKEFTDSATKRFEFFDLNKNGHLEREEFFSPRAHPLLRLYF
jgi:Ca2+-binding EF-hand superfamily protein